MDAAGQRLDCVRIENHALRVAEEVSKASPKTDVYASFPGAQPATYGRGMPTAALTHAFVAKLVAKTETAAEVADFLTGALELANDEVGTIVWFALRTDDKTFWIVDAFPNADARQAHIEGPIAEALVANADRLLAEPPEILAADILASKV